MIPPPPPGQQEIERQEVARLFGQMVGARLLLFPAIAGFALWAAIADPAPWRRAMLGTAALLVAVFFVAEWARYRRRGLTPGAIPLNLALGSVGQATITFATGGLASPFVYVVVPLAVMNGLFVGWRHRPRRVAARLAIAAVQIGALWAMAAIAATGAIRDYGLSALGGGARPGAPTLALALHAAALTLVVAAATAGGAVVRSAFDAMLARALGAQQESLRAHAERAEELTALSAEIAHELKNPLASVKGLAGLLAPQLADGKGAERLGVLRREVDRMQAILDEFLNFSRPLVPLALGRADVAAACREVAALHEGMALERGVAIEVRGGPVPVRCDPRKLKQILINLVQNALDASPAGAAIAIEAEPAEGGGARVRVLDRGRGLDPALAAAAFDPGVTTKPRGSGLGLTIARALARQHGGDLALAPRDGGGTAATLTLPAPGADRAPGEAA